MNEVVGQTRGSQDAATAIRDVPRKLDRVKKTKKNHAKESENLLMIVSKKSVDDREEGKKEEGSKTKRK